MSSSLLLQRCPCVSCSSYLDCFRDGRYVAEWDVAGMTPATSHLMKIIFSLFHLFFYGEALKIYLHPGIYKLFLSNTNNFHTALLVQVLRIIYTQLYGFK